MATLDGTSSKDILAGGSSNDVIWGLAGDDTLQGNDGNDILIGGDGNDQIAGGNGHDVLNGDDILDLSDDDDSSMVVMATTRWMAHNYLDGGTGANKDNLPESAVAAQEIEPKQRILDIGSEAQIFLAQSHSTAFTDATLVDPQGCYALCRQPIRQQTQVIAPCERQIPVAIDRAGAREDQGSRDRRRTCQHRKCSVQSLCADGLLIPRHHSDRLCRTFFELGKCLWKTCEIYAGFAKTCLDFQ